MAVAPKGLPVVLACVLAGSSMSGRQAATASQPAPTKGACRTYDTSTTAVTVAGSLRVTVASSGVFDPWSNRTTQYVTYSDSRGLRYDYTQVTTYASMQDFIAEVVRLQPPAPASSNPPGVQVNILPPLMRFLSTIASGKLAFTMTNSFDAQGRLTGSVNTVPAGSVTTRYTAWDSTGRPIAGTSQQPNNVSTITVSYNDQARTSTTTTDTHGFVAVGTQTFDENGSPRLYVQRVNGNAVSMTTTTAGTTATTCLGDKRVPTAPALAKPGPSPNGTFSALIGGMAWTAELGVQATYADPMLSVGGGDKRYLVSVGLAVKRGLGQYTTGSIDPDKLRTMDEATFKETFARNTVVATLFDSTTRAAWQASPTIGSGTLTLTSLWASGASGTFTLTLEPTPGTGAVGNRTISGTFNVRF